MLWCVHAAGRPHASRGPSRVGRSDQLHPWPTALPLRHSGDVEFVAVDLFRECQNGSSSYDTEGFGHSTGGGSGMLVTTYRLSRSSLSMKRIWLRLDASRFWASQFRAALVISPPATMKAWSTRTRRLVSGSKISWTTSSAPGCGSRRCSRCPLWFFPTHRACLAWPGYRSRGSAASGACSASTRRCRTQVPCPCAQPP